MFFEEDKTLFRAHGSASAVNPGVAFVSGVAVTLVGILALTVRDVAIFSTYVSPEWYSFLFPPSLSSSRCILHY